MTFDNNSYAIIIEKSTGIGAFELLVDPVSQDGLPGIWPKHDVESEIWHDEHFSGYGMMGGGGMMGGNSGSGRMMDGSGSEDMMDDSGSGNTTQIPDVSADMSVSAEDAVQVAQSYLDKY